MSAPQADPAGRARPASATGAHASAATLRTWRRHLADEHAESKIYRRLAERRSGEERAILLELADAEERHAGYWEALLGPDAGRQRRASPRMRLVAWLAGRFGSVFVLALAQRAETRSASIADADATRAMAADERVHEEVLRGLAARGRSRVSGTFRAAVFGANDGLVSNLSLVLGVSGAGVTTNAVLVTGLAGLLAGALSMGAGEYVSVASQRELLDASTPGTATQNALPNLDVDANELALVYRARGMTPADAQVRAHEVLLAYPTGSEPEADPHEDHEVVGTGLGAAVSSFTFFASGAAVPVLPFLFGIEQRTALMIAVILVGLALMLTGAIVGVLSGGPPLRRALRQLAIGLGAAAATYLLGLVFGATLG